MNKRKPFDMLQHIDKLTRTKGGKYICPVCNGENLSVSKNGAYKCFSGACNSEDIREAVAPYGKVDGSTEQVFDALQYRKPSQRDIDKKVTESEILCRIQVQEVFDQIDEGIMSRADGNLSLSAWGRENKQNIFALTQKLKELLKVRDEVKGGNDEEKPRMLREYELIKRKFADKFMWNDLFKRIELEKNEFDVTLSKPFFTIKQKMNIKSGRDDISDIVVMIAKENAFNPVTDYLDSVYQRFGNSTTILDGAAKRYLGNDKTIHNTCLTKWLISAVARAYEPGCKVDNVLILQGGQGVGKSTFFSILASREWFDDSFGNSSDKDERLKLHRTWIVEWAEIESAFKRRDVNAIKNFITTQTDAVRPPYGRDIQSLKRPSVFCGSTNQREFLADETGNRRFWVVAVTQRVPFSMLIRDRDAIWAAAVALYKAGVSWELDEDEKIEIATERMAYEMTDTWTDEVLDFCEFKELVAIADILEIRFNLPKSQQDRKTQIRVKGILSKAGWEPLPNPIMMAGTKKRVWKNPSF